MSFVHASSMSRQTPAGAAGRGLLSGLAAALVLSALSRAPGVMPRRTPRPGRPAAGPGDPFDPQQVRRWQARAQSPAAHGDHGGGRDDSRGDLFYAPRRPPDLSAAGILAEPEAPGPEGLAEQFAFKLASGIFGWNVSAYPRRAGMAVHLVYGSVWGVLLGLLQGSIRRRPALFGLCYGLVVWLVGPALLVPAMKLMRPPWEEPPARTASMVAGHAVYGLAAAGVFEALAPSKP